MGIVCSQEPWHERVCLVMYVFHERLSWYKAKHPPISIYLRTSAVLCSTDLLLAFPLSTCPEIAAPTNTANKISNFTTLLPVLRPVQKDLCAWRNWNCWTNGTTSTFDDGTAFGNSSPLTRSSSLRRLRGYCAPRRNGCDQWRWDICQCRKWVMVPLQAEAECDASHSS